MLVMQQQPPRIIQNYTNPHKTTQKCLNTTKFKQNQQQLLEVANTNYK